MNACACRKSLLSMAAVFSVALLPAGARSADLLRNDAAMRDALDRAERAVDDLNRAAQLNPQNAQALRAPLERARLAVDELDREASWREDAARRKLVLGEGDSDVIRRLNAQRHAEEMREALDRAQRAVDDFGRDLDRRDASGRLRFADPVGLPDNNGYGGADDAAQRARQAVRDMQDGAERFERERQIRRLLR